MFWLKIKNNALANGYRLPPEVEWEYAAKGGENFRYARRNHVDEVAWYRKIVDGRHKV